MENTKQKTIDLYSNAGWKRIFAYIRFWDAPLIRLETFIPKEGTIIELGCGDGILSNYIALSSPKRNVIGVDIDKKRLGIANKKIINTKFILGDIRKINIPKADAIIISHVLHHFSSLGEQEELLRSVIQKLHKNGKLIILEINPTPTPNYFLGWFFDHFLVPIFFEDRIYSPIYYRKPNQWKKLLYSLGISKEIEEIEILNPISNIILAAEI